MLVTNDMLAPAIGINLHHPQYEALITQNYRVNKCNQSHLLLAATFDKQFVLHFHL